MAAPSATPSTVTLSELNALPSSDFVTALSAIYEHSPWVPAAIANQRPFVSVGGLKRAMANVVAHADREKQMALILAHPELAVKGAAAANLAEHSKSEQLKSGMSALSQEEQVKFVAEGRAYREKHHIPFIIAVLTLSREEILRSVGERISNTTEVEIARALVEIDKIAGLRLGKLIPFPGHKRIGVAIVGSGWGPNVQIPAFRQAGLEVLALVGRDKAKMAQLAQQHGVPRATNSIEEVLAMPDVDVVSVVTPPKTHSNFAVKVLRAGKHLLNEKPFAMNSAEAKLMESALIESQCATKKQLIAMVDHELRFHVSMRNIKTFIASGEFGKIQRVAFSYYGLMPPVLQATHEWWQEESEFGGVLGAIGSHYVDLLSFITSSEVVRVSSTLSTCVNVKGGKPVTSDDTAEIRTVHESNPNSKRVNFRGSAAAPQSFSATININAASFGFKRNEMVLLSDRGCIEIDMSAMSAVYTPANIEHPKGLEPKQTLTWHSDAPKDVKGATVISPYVLGTVLVAERLALAIDQADAAAAASQAFEPSSAVLPQPLNGIAATFAEAVYVQTVLDAARESNKDQGAWKTVVVDQ